MSHNAQDFDFSKLYYLSFCFQFIWRPSDSK